MLQHPPFPPLPLAPPDEPDNLLRWGSAVLQYVLEHDLTATLSDAAIEHAIAASTIAIAPRELQRAALDRIAAARWRLITTLDRRQRTAPVLPGSEPAGRQTPKAGPMAPLYPQPLANSPVGGHARPAPTIDF